MQEEWRTIVGFEDYEISSKGRVRSHKCKTPTILRERITHDGYVWYVLCKGGKGHTKRAHRLVAEAFIENALGKPTVNHIDGDKHNNSVENLEWATHEEQMKHAYEHNLKEPMRGVLQPRHLLSESDVQYIRSVYKAHDKLFGMNALAKKFGVSTSTIYDCAHGRTYF